jgi:hypothetical protein
MTIWYNTSPFGLVCAHSVYLSRFSKFGPEKSGNPGFDKRSRLAGCFLSDGQLLKKRLLIFSLIEVKMAAEFS